MQKSQFNLSHSLILLRSRVSKLDSDAPEENKPNKKVPLIFITFHSCFLSTIYARASYLANDVATETSTIHISAYTSLLPIPVHRRTFNVLPSAPNHHVAIFLSSSTLPSTRQCAYSSSGCDKKKLRYTVIFLEIWILRIL